MAAIKASANLFALLDGNDPGDKRLADFDPKHKDEPKKKPVSAAACDYKLKLMTPPAPAATRSKAPGKNLTPAVTAGLLSTAAAKAKAMTKQTTTPAASPARSTNYTGVLFAKAYPSARERIFKERQQRKEEYERRQKAEAKNQRGDDKSVAKQQPAVAVVKKAPTPVAKEPAVDPVVTQTPPPSIDDINQFPSLK